ncbi:hypothetical protein [Shewanella algicola]|uniref:hypothetical protein n=1 Tax=Shewanella algicola TaxID=640633 RepID=UPI002494B937|nr:hypothetical protein [Shewanella algicola]
MNNQKIEEYFAYLKALLDAKITPSAIVGKGYVYPKSVASAWLRKEIHNMENPTVKVDHVSVTTSGKAFGSESKAMKSSVYKSLQAGQFKAINNATVVDFGVMTAPGGDGFMIYACLK